MRPQQQIKTIIGRHRGTNVTRKSPTLIKNWPTAGEDEAKRGKARRETRRRMVIRFSSDHSKTFYLPVEKEVPPPTHIRRTARGGRQRRICYSFFGTLFYQEREEEREGMGDRESEGVMDGE